MPARRAFEPTLLEQLVGLLGGPAAEKLLADFGGHELYVPQAPGEHHPITVSIGVKAAALLADDYAGARLKVPLPRDKAQRILQLDAEGMKTRDIARAVRCTERWVQIVRADAKTPPDSPQADLFVPN